MSSINAFATVWSLLPSLIVVLLAIITRRVLFALGVGIIVGALLINQWDILNSLSYLYHQAIGLIWQDAWQLSKIFIILFLFILGIMAAFISLTGGTAAFGEWILQRVKTRRGAKLSTMLLGLIIFIDDYFNNLAVGNICRPMTDKHRISRSKLAYIIDSTAAPICVLAPLSSWGAYIIALLGPILAMHQLSEYSAMTYFIYLLPMNFYAIFALFMVFAIAYFNWNIGPMKYHEQRAETQGILGGIIDNQEQPTTHSSGHVRDLILPFLTLVICTVGAMIVTGFLAASEQGIDISAIKILEYTESELSLLIGSLSGLIVIMLLATSKKIKLSDYLTTVIVGIKSMLPAIYILLMAWLIITIISGLGTGQYLANQLDGILNPAWLPLLLFCFAGIMAFCTGTSWGTFSIMLPIAGDISAAIEISLMLPSLAAVLAGAVFGDHCSPISDTTILASTGASCKHIDHFITQLPYALITATVAGIAYIILGFTGSISLSLLAMLISYSLLVAYLHFSTKAH